MKRWIVSLLVLSSTGCGSIKFRDHNEVELLKVKRVAVASFSFTQPIETTLLGTGGPDASVHASPEVDNTLKDMSATLNKIQNWSVLAAEQMRENPQYKQVYAGKMKGLQYGKVPHQGKLFLVSGVMDAQSLRRLKSVERDQLMDALKVDALIELMVNVNFATKGVAFMGIGSRYPQATASLWMYKRGVEKPVWFDGRIVGEAASESVGKTGFFDETVVTRLGRLSAKGAFEKLNYKNQ